MTDSTFRLSPNATFWVLFVALSLIALLVFSEILLPFAAGFVLAYLFQPFVGEHEPLGHRSRNRRVYHHRSRGRSSSRSSPR